MSEKGKYSRDGDAFIQTFHRQMSFLIDSMVRSRDSNSIIHSYSNYFVSWRVEYTYSMQTHRKTVLKNHNAFAVAIVGKGAKRFEFEMTILLCSTTRSAMPCFMFSLPTVLL